MPGLLCSPLCLTVIWFLSWLLHHGCAQIQTDEVPGMQYGRLESNVTLVCGKSKTGIPVIWHVNHSSALPRHKVTSDGNVVLLNANHSAQGNYSCYNSQGLLLHSVTLRLGYPPGLLTISCQVPNHTHVRCSWLDSVQTFLPAQYNASFRGTGQEWRPCIMDVTRKLCDVYQPAFWQTIHTLRVTETNGLGSQATSVRFRLNDLLKPDPPESVTVKPVEGYSKKLIVSWSFPSSWPLHNAFPLMFHIRYRPLGSIYWSEIYSEESPVEIFDALEDHLHQVQVQAQDEVNSDSQWSDWSPVRLIRPWQATPTPVPTEDLLQEEYLFPLYTKPETSTAKPHTPALEEEDNLGWVILLVLLSVVILTTVLSLILVVWVRQKRRNHVTIHELASMVKMKSMPI
ncbi:interleukin-11 receptor subunit alpha [Brachionichthys hirsutus]|uniref:interleukin-11 receptor subunit alpha n=1 Tax=Brachionichthys hirsutus TaxID=412623 RepID=UPI0036051885